MVKSNQRTGSEIGDKDKTMRTGQPDQSSRHAGAPIDPRIQTEIGKHLRAIYDDVINEPVPSKFMDLLEQLEQSTTRKN